MDQVSILFYICVKTSISIINPEESFLAPNKKIKLDDNNKNNNQAPSKQIHFTITETEKITNQNGFKVY